MESELKALLQDRAPCNLPEELEVGDGLGVVAQGVAKLDHGLAEVREAVMVHL